MKTYIKFLLNLFLNSFVKVFFLLSILIFIINIFEEIEFFKKFDVHFLFTLSLSLLNTPSIIFEIFPFIFLITTQLFFIKLIDTNELKIFKYSGLKNIKILTIISIFTFILGFLIVTLFYNLSSQTKNYYLKIKNQYSDDNKYLAVITENGLWIKDEINSNINIINSSKIDGIFLTDVTIVQFDNKNNFVRSIKSKKVDISQNNWIIFEPSINENYKTKTINSLTLNTNFNFKKINNLFSNLSALTIFELFDLKNSYKNLNYSNTDVVAHLYKIYSYPFYLTIITILSGILMLNIKYQKNTIFKIILGIFISVVIYYLNNFFNVLGSTEKIPLLMGIWLPLAILAIINSIFIIKINEK